MKLNAYYDFNAFWLDRHIADTTSENVIHEKRDITSYINKRDFFNGVWRFTARRYDKLPQQFRYLEKLCTKISEFQHATSGSLGYFGPAKASIKRRCSYAADFRENKREFILSLLQNFKRLRPISDLRISYVSCIEDRRYLNSIGSMLDISAGSCFLLIRFLVKREGAAERASVFHGIHDDVLLTNSKSVAEDIVCEIEDECLEDEKISIQPIRIPVVLSPLVAGYVIHEAVGHCCEGDIIRSGRSYLSEKLGKKIADNRLTVLEDPTIPEAFGSYRYDYEGIPAKRKILVKNGILSSYILDRNEAGNLGLKPTGGLRSWDPMKPPSLRLSNTYAEQGDCSTDEIFKSVKFGVYAEKCDSATCNLETGSMVLHLTKAYIIRKGNKAERLRNIIMSLSMNSALMNIRMIGKESRPLSPRLCKKSGQLMPVTIGGPLMLLGPTRVSSL